MAFQVDSSCYSTALAAAQAAASSQIGKVVSIGAASYVVDVSAVSATSITYKFQNVASAAVLTKVAAHNPQPCGLLDTADALVIAWGIAAVWLIVYAVVFVRKGIHE